MPHRIGHFKVVYPLETPKGVMRVSRDAKVFLLVEDEEILLPGVRAVTFKANLHEPDRVRLEFVGTVEIVYAD